MKQKIIPTTIIALALTSQTLIAGPITDAYTTGDTLTTTTLDNIKTEVNDNDSRITANDGQITTNQALISSNQSAISSNQSAITNNKSVVEYDRTICNSCYSNYGDSSFLTQTVSTVTSVTINAPSAGRIIVSFSGQYDMASSGSLDMFCIEIESVEWGAPSPSCDGSLMLLAPIDASHRRIFTAGQGGIHTQQIFLVSDAGSYTYYLRGQSNREIGTDVAIRQSNMIAYFVAD